MPRISRFRKKLKDIDNNSSFEEIMNIVSGVEENAIIFSDLFKRLDPLATGKRTKSQLLNIKDEIKKSLDIFKNEMESNEISFEINGKDGLLFLAWPQDIYAIFTNLIDNSIYWLKTMKDNRKITINIFDDKNNLEFIDIKDTGPGIEYSLIKDNVIFEPDFSTKLIGHNTGTGIGLAIAGEAAARNNLELNALDSRVGAYFRLQVKDANND